MLYQVQYGEYKTIERIDNCAPHGELLTSVLPRRCVRVCGCPL